MFKWIDNLLNRVTMYRLVLYALVFLLVVAFVLCLCGFLPFNPFALVFSTLFLITVCFIAHEMCAMIFRAPTNTESVYITALILALILSPPIAPADGSYFSLAIWASVWAMASKYLFAIKKKHVFNPAAIAVVLTALVINQSASWWVGTLAMLPWVLVSGFLIVKKIRRFDLVLAFIGAALVSIVGSGLLRGVNPLTLISKTLVDTPILFFASVMLTEPLTTPPTKKLRIGYGLITGILFAPWVHIGSFYSTPEIALVIGNIFAYVVSPKHKFIMPLKEEVPIAENTADFVFQPDRPLVYRPGQYMEWTLAHDNPDSRGNRRYFTLASSPTEKDVRLGIKFYPSGSSFKHALLHMSATDKIVASHLAGDFLVPADASQKLVFIAGGIGVTPFRSMLKYLIDTRERRDIIVFYSNKTVGEIAYADIFTAAHDTLGIKTVYTLTDKTAIPKDWKGNVGAVDGKMITDEVPDVVERLFYISGPHGMVVAFQKTLKDLGVPASHIKTDFFPGFA